MKDINEQVGLTQKEIPISKFGKLFLIDFLEAVFPVLVVVFILFDYNLGTFQRPQDVAPLFATLGYVCQNADI
jgi:hypothetical protein